MASLCGDARALLTRRLADGLLDCCTFYCVGKDSDSNFQRTRSSGYKKYATKCKGYISTEDAEKFGGDKSRMDAGAYGSALSLEHCLDIAWF